MSQVEVREKRFFPALSYYSLRNILAIYHRNVQHNQKKILSPISLPCCRDQPPFKYVAVRDLIPESIRRML